MKNKGFTLIELLVVISIIAILSTVVFVALNPAGRFAEAREARRFNDVNNILTAIHECIVDNAGDSTACMESGGSALTAGSVYEIVNTGVATACDDVCTTADGDGYCATIDDELAAYLASLPVDPGGVATNHTEYTVSVDTNGIVTVASCNTETAGSGTAIQVSR